MVVYLESHVWRDYECAPIDYCHKLLCRSIFVNLFMRFRIKNSVKFHLYLNQRRHQAEYRDETLTCSQANAPYTHMITVLEYYLFCKAILPLLDSAFSTKRDGVRWS